MELTEDEKKHIRNIILKDSNITFSEINRKIFNYDSDKMVYFLFDILSVEEFIKIKKTMDKNLEPQYQRSATNFA